MTSHAGRFVWRELVTPDTGAAATFYNQAFGWAHTVAPMGEGLDYTMFSRPGVEAQIAGAMQPMMAGVPAHWVDYITVDDVDASREKVVALGGTAITEVMDIPVGRFAIVKDPAGAVFALFTSATPGASDTDSPPDEHTFCWSQLMTDQLDRVVPFYAEVFGWQPAPMPGGMVVFNRGDKPVASAMSLPEGAPAPAHWLQYVAVADATVATDTAVAAGASVLQPVTEMPGMGIFSVMADPAGAVFAVWKDLGAANN